MKHQEGVTLVIAVVMLATVTFVSFSLSSVIIREIRSAQLILRTEPAISGANSGGEIGLYRLLREVGSTNTQGSTPQSGASYQVTPDLYEDSYNFSVSGGSELKVALYDAENVSNKNANYGSVTVFNNQGSNPVKVSVFSWEDTKNAVCGQTTVPGNQSFSCAGLNRADDRYLVVITLPGGGGQATGYIQATDNSSNSKGVPADSPQMDVVGSSGNVQRKIEINIRSQ